MLTYADWSIAKLLSAHGMQIDLSSINRSIKNNLQINHELKTDWRKMKAKIVSKILNNHGPNSLTLLFSHKVN